MTKVIPARLGRDWVNKIRLSLVGQASIVAMSHTGTAGIRRQVCRCTKQDIATFNQRCSVGTKARLAMTLVLSDLDATEEPNAEAGHADHPGSSQTAARHRSDADDRGEDLPRHQIRQTFYGCRLRQWMRERCDEAGLPDCSSHGRREAIARRMAEAGRRLPGTRHSRRSSGTQRRRGRSWQKLMAEMAMRGLEEPVVPVND
jgi:hypothetical protein